MNEWLNEKAQEASATKPLTIKTEPADMLAAGSSSPVSSSQLTKSGPLLNLGTREAKGNLEASFGSAKKVCFQFPINPVLKLHYNLSWKQKFHTVIESILNIFLVMVDETSHWKDKTLIAQVP